MKIHSYQQLFFIYLTYLLCGCSTTNDPTITLQNPDEEEISTQSISANKEALIEIEAGNLDEAEKILKQAIENDPGCGPIHNNLGKVYYLNGNLYTAAREFHLAASLMPYRAEPLNNLGLVFENSSQLKKAVEYYHLAMDLHPTSSEISANLARALIKTGNDTEELVLLLKRIALEDSRSNWANWARKELAFRTKTE